MLGQSFGGALTPADAREVPRISGLVGSVAPNRPVLDPNPPPRDEEQLIDDPIGEPISEPISDPIDDSLEVIDSRELELGLPDDGGQSKWLLSGRSLFDRLSDDEQSALDGISHVAMFGSDRNDSVVLKFNSSGASDLDQLELLAGDGRDRVRLVGSVTHSVGALDVVIEGERGPDRLDARRYEDSVVLDGGPGRDLLIGGRSESELWGGAGRDTFQLRSGGGIQRIQDFDTNEDRLIMKKIPAEQLILEERDDDLWLLIGDQPLAVFVDLAEQHTDFTRLLRLNSMAV